MSEIHINEAISVADKLVNHFRAFEKIREVLIRVAQAEQGVVEAEHRRDEHEAATKAADEKLADLDRCIAEQQGVFEEQEKAAKERLSEIASRGASEKQKLEDSFGELRAKFNLLNVHLSAEHSEKMKVYKAEEQDLERRISELSQVLDGLRQKVQGL